MVKKTEAKISKPQSLRVLMVEDSEDDVLLIIRELKKGGYNPVYELVETAATMKKALKEKQWDIIICDYKLPKFDAPSAITLLKEANIDIPVIIVSGSIGEETAVECMRLGAHDYIMKNSLSRLCPAINRELEEAEVRNKHRQAEKALKESEEKYRTILDEMEDVYLEVDLAGNFTFFNDAILYHVGYSKEELIGTSFRDRVAKEDITNLYNTFGKIYSTGKPERSIFYKFMHKDGTMISVEAAVFPLYNQKGEIVGFRGIAIDITKRKQSEEALRDSEKYFKEITENSSDIIIIADKNGDIKYCSRSAERLIGYKPEDLIGRNVIKLIHPDDVERAVSDFGKAILLKDTAIPNAFRILHKDGSERYFEGLGKNLLDNPAVAGFIMNVHDITERKQAEEKIRQSEERYRTILDEMEDAYFEVDIAGNYTFVNDACCRHLGYSREELIGTTFRDQMAKEEIAGVYKAFSNIYTTGKPEKVILYKVLRKDGTSGLTEMAVFPPDSLFFNHARLVKGRVLLREYRERMY